MATALTRTLLETLIGFDTTSVHSNLALMHFIQNYLQQHGVDSTLIHDESGEKANLWPWHHRYERFYRRGAGCCA